jgi:hypothetical protein
VGTWLRKVANPRVHATTGEIPLIRLELERERRQPLPAPWCGTIIGTRIRTAAVPSGYQQSLRVYDELITAAPE